MCKHIFLTGSVQAGKSTVLEKVLAGLNVTVGGFRSGSGTQRHEADRWLYLWDVMERPIFDAAHRVAYITPEKRCAYPERFDTLGCAALRRAKQTGADLIVMDECGFLERDAAIFQAEVLNTLDGDIPVLGVVRLRSDGWTDAIRNHPNVTLITVTAENRDQLPGQIITMMQRNEGSSMELQTALEQLKELQIKQYAYGCAQSALYLDSVTVAPRDTAEGRGVALGILAGESHKLFSDPKVGELLEFLSEHTGELELSQRRQAEELRRSYRQLSRIPAEEYMEYAMLTNEASDVWHRAKEESNFELFRPVLEKLVAFNRKFAGYYDSTKAPYDALLNEYERGVDMAYLDEFFSALRQRLVPLIRAIGEKDQIEDSFLYRRYPLEDQRRFSDYLMEVMGLDRAHCTIGETEHPFTLNFNNKDVRITTNYQEANVADSMYSVIHEGGHAMYELQIADDIQYTCLAGGVSMGVHESQSRFYENIIGRSRPFVEAIFPRMQEIFPEQLADVTAEQFYRAVNKAQPSLIRTEADELTYSFHVMVRYEIEKQLIGGTLEVKDVPVEWNRLYKEYLGVDVPDDKHGCLQDSHWSGGSFGYFPSYALGSAYAAQMLRRMEQDINVWDGVAQGDLSAVSAWLADKVHRFGGLLEPAQVVENACGKFDPNYYVDYLTEKYSALYGL